MEASLKGASRWDTLTRMVQRLKAKDHEFWAVVEESIEKKVSYSCLLQLLLFVESDIDLPTKFATTLLDCLEEVEVEGNDHNLKSHLFLVNGFRLNVTLEDILYLTRLPIVGRPLIPAAEKGKDLNAFRRVFGLEHDSETLPMSHFINLACDKACEQTRRIQAVLLLIITCIVIPSSVGHICRASYVQLIEDLDKVGQYAWGAAILAFLYEGFKLWKQGRKSMKGNIWIVMGFFLYHIPKLQETLRIPLELPTPAKAPLGCVVDALRVKGKNHRHDKSIEDVAEFLKQLGDNDITWQPYNLVMLPAHLHEHIPYCSITTPIFCFNYVIYHLPNLVANQFDGLALVDLSGYEEIKIKQNSGVNNQDFPKHYQKELNIWDKVMESWSPPTATSSSSPPHSSASPAHAFNTPHSLRLDLQNNPHSPSPEGTRSNTPHSPSPEGSPPHSSASPAHASNTPHSPRLDLQNNPHSPSSEGARSNTPHSPSPEGARAQSSAFLASSSPPHSPRLDTSPHSSHPRSPLSPIEQLHLAVGHDEQVHSPPPKKRRRGVQSQQGPLRVSSRVKKSPKRYTYWKYHTNVNKRLQRKQEQRKQLALGQRK